MAVDLRFLQGLRSEAHLAFSSLQAFALLLHRPCCCLLIWLMLVEQQVWSYFGCCEVCYESLDQTDQRAMRQGAEQRLISIAPVGVVATCSKAFTLSAAGAGYHMHGLLYSYWVSDPRKQRCLCSSCLGSLREYSQPCLREVCCSSREFC